MKIGQVVIAFGALLVLVGAFLPLYDVVYEGKVILLHESMWGVAVMALAFAVLPVVGYGFYFRKVQRAALLNVAMGSVVMGMIVFITAKAPYVFGEVHSLPFDEQGVFTGFMAGAAGLYLVWLGGLAVLFGSLKTVGSHQTFPKDAQFLRVALNWNDSLLKEVVLFEGRDISVGSELNCTFSVPTSIKKMNFIKYSAGPHPKFFLGLAKGLDGDVKIGGKTDSAQAYKKENTANTSGVDYVKLKPGDEGKFKIGDLVLSFAFICPGLTGARRSLVFDRDLPASVIFSLATQAAFLLIPVMTLQPLNLAARQKEQAKRFIKIDLKKDMKMKEREKKEEEKKELAEKKEEEVVKEEEEKLEEEVETPTIEQKAQSAGDPLKKEAEVDRKDEEFKPMKEGSIGKDAKRDSELAKAMKKKGVIAVLDSKMTRNTSLSKLLGKERNLTMKNLVWAEDGEYELTNEGDSDLSYMGSTGGTGDFGGGGGFGGAGGFGGGGGGFGGGGAFGLGGMGGLGGGLPGGIGGADANRSGRMAMASLKDRERKRASRVKMDQGSMGQFCKKADVQRKVQGRAAAIRACYEMQLQMKPDLAGKVTLQWIIDLTGRVKGVKVVDNSTGNGKLDACISKIIGKIHFQPPQGGMCIIRWPFVFSPGG